MTELKLTIFLFYLLIQPFGHGMVDSGNMQDAWHFTT